MTRVRLLLAVAGAGITATLLNGTPPDLFMSAGDQSAYDMCIAVHPTTAGRLYVGGAAAGASGDAASGSSWLL